MIDDFKNLCSDKIDLFIKKVLPLSYIINGISLSEGFAFCMMCEYFKINTIIESGTAGGRSTEIFAHYLNIPVYTIDNLSIYGERRHEETKNRLSKYQDIHFIIGDSFIEIPKLLNSLTNKVAVFIDGPKGQKAIKLANLILKSNVEFIGVHDTCVPSPNRYHDLSVFKNIIFYTDEDWFYNKYGYLIDEKLYERGAGIGFILNKGI